MQKGLPLGNAAGKAIAEPDGVGRIRHRTDLKLDVLEVPKETANDREGVEIVGTEQALGIADGADGKLIGKAVSRKPLQDEWGESEGLISGPRSLGSLSRGRYADAQILRVCRFQCHGLTLA